MELQPCVYLLASKRNGTLYTGVTSNLTKRIWEHKNNLVAGFTKKYSVHTLVWYEVHETMEFAIRREKAIKNWKRSWKIKVIEEENPGWHDLYPDLLLTGCILTIRWHPWKTWIPACAGMTTLRQFTRKRI
jgi:putative endonuclease